MGGLSGVQGSCPYAVDVDEVGRMTEMLPGNAGGPRPASVDDGPCLGHCRGENICGPPYPPWGKSYPCHGGP
jgi:hypothetical protein